VLYHLASKKILYQVQRAELPHGALSSLTGASRFVCLRPLASAEQFVLASFFTFFP
jgi:hypothetical protein